MKDWNGIARKVVADNLAPSDDGKKHYTWNIEGLIKAVAAALEAAEEGGALPAPGRPVLVNDKWLEHLNNKIAQINQRLNQIEGAQRGMGDIVTAQATRLDEHRRLIDNVDVAQLTLDRRLADLEKS